MPYIWRLSAIGLWKETTAGTRANAQVRIPKEGGVLNPSFEEATDQSWYWVIDEIADSHTTKNFSNITLTWSVRDSFIWYLLLGALWKYTKLYCVKGTATGGTPKRGDVATTTNAVLKKILKINGTTYYFFDKAVSWTITNGTWSISSQAVSGVNAHLFERLNSNQHPTFTLYDDDPVAWSYAPYSMINSFELSCAVSDYVKFSAEFMWKQMKDAWSQNPAYWTENPFLASGAGVKFATNESGLNDASEQCMQNFRVAINKNLTDIQCFGSTDVDAFYNQQFGVEGDFEALYNNTTLRDYVVNSEKKAVRFYCENRSATPLTTNVYPSIYVDLFKVGLNEWTKTDSANEIVKQTMWFTGQYSNDDSATIEVLLLNSNSTWY